MAQATARSPPNDGELAGQITVDEAMSQRLPEDNNKSVWQKLYSFLAYTPPRCRYDPEKPVQFSMGLNILFAFAACFTVANLYYTHPILNLFAEDFHVTNQEASHIPALAQAGYAAGLLFLCPLGDLVKRRPFTLWLVWFTATLWVGLCVTRSFAVFGAISFITSVTTVTPQLMLPLVGDLAPPHRRASALSIVVSGLLLGMLCARLLSGVVAEFIGWRYIYWISFGLQYLILALLWLFMPDYPSTNPGETVWKRYPFLLWDILKLLVRQPVLVQACLIGMLTSTIFTNYWTTLTFLLAGDPYHYSSLVIGLFALIGMGAMMWGPFYARLVMDKHQPLLSIIIGELICLAGVIIGAYTGKFTVAGPIIEALFIDMGVQQSQTANRTAIYSVAPLARNRVNTAYMVSVFTGQLIGTVVGNAVYAQGGWIASGSTSVGFVGAALIIALMRGPHETGWIGWQGGYNMKKGVPKHPTKDVDVELERGSEPEDGQPEAVEDTEIKMTHLQQEDSESHPKSDKFVIDHGSQPPYGKLDEDRFPEKE